VEPPPLRELQRGPGHSLVAWLYAKPLLSVLYIEDDRRIAGLMTKYLETHGIVVWHAPNGAEASARNGDIGRISSCST
jgi:hypothetical protein